jgi:hypothetical protein
MNGSSKGVLHKPKKIITRRVSMRPGINSTQKLLTLDFPTSPSLRNFAGFTPGASQAREDSRRYREKRDRSLLSEAAKEKGFDELLELSGLWTGSRQISRNVRTRVLTVAFAASR